jgi:hypothetical protein
MPEVVPWEIIPLGNQFGMFWVAVDEFDRANLFLVDLSWHSTLRLAVDRSTRRRITHFTLNTAGTRSLHSSTVCLTDIGVGGSIFRRDGKGGWIGLFDESNFWTSTYEVKYIETRQESLCRNSTVDARETYDGRTLWINGSGGDEEHIARVDAGQSLVLSMESSCDIPALRFYVQARPGTPKTSQVSRFPGGGISCFEFLDHDSAKAIWNGLGGLRGKLGSSRILQTAIPDPRSVPGVFFTIPGWATQNLPPGTTATFQGFQSDPSSKKGLSVTNAVVLIIE